MEILRRYYEGCVERAKGQADECVVRKLELVMQQADVTPDICPAVAASLAKASATGKPAGAMVLPDGGVVTGKTSPLLGASASLLLNALKHMAGIDHRLDLIPPSVIEPISAMKTDCLGHRNPRLHSDEVLIALAISALTNPLAAMVQPTAMLFTIIGHAHLEFLRDRRGVLQEKTSVLDTMPDDAVAFCNGDDDLLRAMTCRQRKVAFGLSAGCDVRAVDVRDLGDEGSTCTIIAGTRRIPVRISAYGQHMVYAALEGAAVGIEYGLTDDEIIRGIAAYQPVGSRARVVRTARYTVIDDCYNANPDSTAAALRSMATLPACRRVAVLGNMGELGANAAALHRETGVCAAKAGVSLVITCGELARQIAAGAAAEDPAVATASFDTLDALLPALPGLLQPGDCVLVKASHSMQFERIVQALTQA